MSEIETTYIQDIARFDGREVELRGWLVGRRSGGKLQFLNFRDGSGFIQIVVSKAEVEEKVWVNAKSLTQESSIRVKGLVRGDERAPGGFELDLQGSRGHPES